ncbi:hypothetical protein [Flexithrix dorotheae]|uniref:hypothetical protein n=1 Tax=Flexithrix dorotheae TaxID=70993 RepID=UPI00037DD456|nr:hypothetical protein [Flexithrix dorotheae]
MYLKDVSIEIINQLIDVTRQLQPGEFSLPLELLSGSSIGKHQRHVIEFYQILLSNYKKGKLSYDKRAHNGEMENNRDKAIMALQKLKDSLQLLKSDKALLLGASYSTDKDEKIYMESSLARELAFNLEHAIHHMAIVKIAIKLNFPHISIPKNFGIAYSTLQYEKSNEDKKETFVLQPKV